jgi:hypothetical protein
MKKTTRLLAGLVSILLLIATQAHGELSFRTWTSRKGATIKARLLTDDGKVAVIERPSGQTVDVPRSYLSGKDIAYLDSAEVRKAMGRELPKVKPKPPDKPVIGVVGASISAGYGNRIKAATVLDICLPDNCTVVNGATPEFFLSPVYFGRQTVSAITQQNATAIMGMDFLFWYAYGSKTFEQRKQHLQAAFRLLDGVNRPVFVGDLPRATDNTQLSYDMIPSTNQLAELNRMIYDWAGKQTNAYVVPVASWFDSAKSSSVVTLNKKKVPLKKTEIFQPDGLHTTEQGLTYVVLLVLDHMVERGGVVDEKKVLRDPEQVLARVNKESAAMENRKR